MSKSRRRTEGILRILRAELEQLELFYALAIRLEEAANEGLGERPGWIFDGIYQACRRSLLTGLAGLLSTDQESITLKYLFDHVRNHPYGFEASSPDRILEMVERADAALDVLREFEERLRTVRDRKLAHIDRKHLNEPERLSESDVGLVEVRQAMDRIGPIFDDFWEAFHGSETSLRSMRVQDRMMIDRMIAAWARLEDTR